MGLRSRPQSRRFEFTKKRIEGLPAHDADSPSREAEYSDSACVGLHLRVSKNGRRFFQHRYRLFGRKKCLSLGEFPHVSLQDARQRVGEQRGLLARDVDPAGEREQKRNDITLEEFVAAYYLPQARLRKKTVQDDVYRLEARILPALGKLRLSSITTRDVTQFGAKERERNSATSANHYIGLLKTIMNLAVKLQMLEMNPAGCVDKYKQNPPRERYLSRTELPHFLAALDELGDTLSAAAIKLALYTGCRRGEVVSLKWENVIFGDSNGGASPHLRLPLTKNGKGHTVHLNTKALEVLECLARKREESPRTRNSEFVFPSRRATKRGHIFDLRKTVSLVCERAGIETAGKDKFTFHSLRHTYATLAILSAKPETVQKLLNHSQINMTMRYAHVVDESMKLATENVAQEIDRVLADGAALAAAG